MIAMLVDEVRGGSVHYGALSTMRSDKVGF